MLKLKFAINKFYTKHVFNCFNCQISDFCYARKVIHSNFVEHTNLCEKFHSV